MNGKAGRCYGGIRFEDGGKKDEWIGTKESISKRISERRASSSKVKIMHHG